LKKERDKQKENETIIIFGYYTGEHREKNQRRLVERYSLFEHIPKRSI
jgi:hypothetical protein